MKQCHDGGILGMAPFIFAFLAGCAEGPQAEVPYLGIPNTKLVRTADLHNAALQKKFASYEYVTEVIPVSREFYSAQKKSGQVLFEEQRGTEIFFSIGDLTDLPVQASRADATLSVSRSWVFALWRYRTPARSTGRQQSQPTSARFRFSPGNSGGVLSWRSHTFDRVGDELVPKQDYIVEDLQAGVVSVCLEWRTVPDASSGEFLDAFGSWEIPISALQESERVLSVARQSSESIVFILSTGRGVILLKSAPFPISKGWSGDMKDLNPHITPVPLSALDEDSSH